MNKFFLKITFSLTLLTGPLNALLITPKAKELAANIVNAESEYKDACLAQLLMIQLGNLSADEIDQLRIPNRPKHDESNAQLPTALISLICEYTAGKNIDSIACAPDEEEKKEDGELKEAADEEEKKEVVVVKEKKAAAAQDPDILGAQLPAPGNKKTKLEEIRETKAKKMLKITAARWKRKKYHDNINAKKRQFCSDYERLDAQESLELKSIQQNIITSFISLWYLATQSDLFFFLSQHYPRLHERLKTASLGAAKAIPPSFCYMFYQACIGPTFNNSPINYENCISGKRFISPLRMAGVYMLLDVAHKYGHDMLNKKIDLQQYHDALQAHLADPDIDIDYDSVTKKFGWLAKVLIAARLTSTYV